jgi:cysteine desulfuration protein SufE
LPQAAASETSWRGGQRFATISAAPNPRRSTWDKASDAARAGRPAVLNGPCGPAIYLAGRNGKNVMTQAPTIAEEQRLIAADFALFDDWRDRIEYVLDLGRNLAPFPEQHRTESNKVRGCQSQVWMVAQLDAGSGRMQIAADSDAFIVRGLIALLLRLYANRRPQEILDNPPEVFNEIGLGGHLSPTRANGLHAMIKRIRQLASGQVHGVEVAAAQ